ncbi:hypothetical protein MBEHAL_1273 [Halarchaeum acidiphilum MH1-52-1]|uniref:Uncharacterized protein n=1 Tax=Halarchaeum acidiphilum MH1-52-1 TaxID=1261545 RepID=U3ACL2_9EURY|nr:hypothetical protein MBEHAL_1273 [Halarchaeum acidiphilum MH1-52-1]
MPRRRSVSATVAAFSTGPVSLASGSPFRTTVTGRFAPRSHTGDLRGYSSERSRDDAATLTAPREVPGMDQSEFDRRTTESEPLGT